MNRSNIKQRITQSLDNLSFEQLTLVEKLVSDITAYFQTAQSVKITSEINQNKDDPLAQLRNSDFIGCFSDDTDLAEKSEEIGQRILSQKDSL